MSNIHECLNCAKPYFAFNREERNLAAIFYHVLMLEWPENLRRFLTLVSCEFPVKSYEDVGIYFEYSYLRDFWAALGKSDSNKKKRELIYKCLQPSNAEELEKMSVFEFNSYFGAVPRPSRKFIQSPGNWSIARFGDNIADRHEFFRVCRFKWSFKAKPDIVIHLSHDTAICIEAKLKSGEASYPTKPSEINEFRRRRLPFVKQTSLQKYMMKDLLGMDTEFIFLVQKPLAQHGNRRILLWKEAFASMDTSNCPPFVKNWIQML